MIEDLTRGKLQQVFNFVKALNELRNPVQKDIKEYAWKLWFNELPLDLRLKINDIGNNDENLLDGKDTILTVKRPELTECPPPQEELERWISGKWRDPYTKIGLLEKIERAGENGEKETICIEVTHEIRDEFEEWNRARDEWISREIPLRRTMDIFKSLYKLYSDIQKESESVELILGDGLLNWNVNGEMKIYHPVLLQRVELKFNSEVPEFKICFTDQGPELYNAMFRSVTEINIAEIAKCNSELEEKGCEILGEENTNNFLQRVVLALSPEGQFSSISIKPEDNRPYITREPVIFLRKRNLGYSSAIEAVLEDISNDGEIPSFMKKITGISESKTSYLNNCSFNAFESFNGEDCDILFTKPANSEQLLAAKYLQKNGAVLIQGPPGTGKTHTIANLVGHLLAEGKSVLITSYSEKALRVLRDKIVEPLKPLCLPVLSSVESKREMEKTLDAMDEKQSSINVEFLRRQISDLAKTREKIIEELNKKKEELKRERLNEYRNIVIGGNEYTPIEAAKYIAENSEKSNWIPSPVLLGSPLPVSQEEVKALYKTNTIMTEVDEMDCVVELPDIEKLLDISAFSSLVKDYDELNSFDIEYGIELWKGNEVDENNIKSILTRMLTAVKVIEDGGWMLDIIEAGYSESRERDSWEKLIEEVNGVYTKSVDFKKIFIEFNPQIQGDFINEEAIKVLDEIIQHLSTKDRIGSIKLLTKPRWKEIINASSINDKRPESLSDFKAIKDFVNLSVLREKLEQRWNRQVGSINGPKTDEFRGSIEDTAKFYCDMIQGSLDWYSTVLKPLEMELKANGFNFDMFMSQRELIAPKNNELLLLSKRVNEVLPKVIDAECRRLKLQKINAQIESLMSYLNNFNDGRLNAEFKKAVESHSVKDYIACLSRMCQFLEFRKHLVFRKQILETIEKFAPGWAYAIKNREGLHGRSEVPGSCEVAWIFRQLNDELERRSKVNISDVQQQISQLEDNLREITGKLVDNKAWERKLSTMTDEEIQAINGWKITMKRIGSGKGKRAPVLQAQARNLMLKCQSAVPVWIMPISRVVENFNPRDNKFDVIIIDEASQADMMALPVIYMARQVVVVGDDEQVSPVDVGKKADEVQRLIDTYLDGIPNKELYTGQFSIYDMAKTCGYQPVCLREHFRCAAPIIEFSNNLSYNGKIKPLRDESSVVCKPALVPYRVEGATSNNKVNVEEAKTIASLLLSCIEQSEYDGKTFGVISMVGEEQAAYVEALLQKHMSPSDYVERKVQCGNSAQFQGDERDVVFLSLVDAPNGSGPLSLRRDGADDMYKKRYNVAASRACDQLWVVYSLNPEIDLKEGDLRLRLIRHAKNPYELSNSIEAVESRAESEFERLVINRLIKSGYRVIPQWKVGAYRIDIVVEGGGRRLAIECDGERYHTPENLEEDIQRQAILERLGWRFARIRGSHFFRDPDKAMEPVFKKLGELNILPEGNGMDLKACSGGEELLNRVKRRAAQILQELKEE